MTHEGLKWLLMWRPKIAVESSQLNMRGMTVTGAKSSKLNIQFMY